LNKAIARRWARALRSGKYKQGRRYLKQKDANGKLLYCCLGVLCELYQAERARKKKRKLVVYVKTNLIAESHVFSFSQSHFRAGSCYYHNVASELPMAVMRWAGIRSSVGDYSDGFVDKPCESLTVDNDTHRKSFRRIATVIEKNVDKL
jgi:hypothetical protein